MLQTSRYPKNKQKNRREMFYFHFATWFHDTVCVACTNFNVFSRKLKMEETLKNV